MTEKNTEKIAELERRIEEYFSGCDVQNEKKIKKPYTLSGLLCKLEITRRDFERLASKRSFAAVVCKALAKIEAFTEEHALTGELSSNAAANSLKYNFGWNDKKSDEDKGASEKSIKIILDGELAHLAE